MNRIFNIVYVGSIILVFYSPLSSEDNSNSSISNKNLFEEKVIWKDNFESKELNGWEIIDDLPEDHSNWYLEEGFLIQDTDYGDTKNLVGTNIINGNIEWDNYVVRANLICTDDDYIGILFRYNDNDNYYRFLLSSQRKDIRIDKKVNGAFVNIATYSEEEYQLTKFTVTIFLFDSNIKLFLNETKYFDLDDEQFKNGKIGFTSISNLGSFFDDVTVYSEYRIEKADTIPEFTRGPYLQSVLDDQAVVIWNTSLPMPSLVEYGLSKEQSNIVNSNDLTCLHEVILKNLLHESVYYYRIISGSLIGEWNNFKTAVNDSTPFNFIVYGDNQLNFLKHSEIVNQFGKHQFDFIISCGDVVQRGPRADWDMEFFNPLKKVLEEKPIYAAIGNHELNSSNYYRYFCNPNPEHENYYSFKYGNSYFIFLDNPLAAYPDKSYYTDYTQGSEQYKWLENKLSSDEAQTADWLFVISHVPSYVGGSQEYFAGCKKNLVPLFEKYKVDFSISGHIHGYERGSINGINYIVTAGGGGAQNKKSNSLLKQYKDFKLIYNFCLVEVCGSIIKFSAFDINNEIIDQFEIKKEN